MNTNKILIIGDVHGKLIEYENIIKSTELSSIQVGDFGFGEHHRWHLSNIDSEKHKINFGNHDNYDFLGGKHSLGDYSFQFKNKLMTIRGADSIDKNWRTEGVSWWRNEEIDYYLLQGIIDIYYERKPEVIISHDCPQSIREKLFGISDCSRTSAALQTMFELHQPKLWVFGHYHKSVSTIENHTVFQCLKELETLEVEIT